MRPAVVRCRRRPARISPSAPSSRWSLRAEGGRQWLVTPCGERFYLAPGSTCSTARSRSSRCRAMSATSWQRYYPSIEAWRDDTRRRIAAWGFNTAGAWSLPPDFLKLPSVPNLELGRLARFHWFDPFDPETEAAMRELAPSLVAAYKGSPYRIGYFSDNEVGWWSGALFVFYSTKPATNHTKQRWIEMLRDQYGDDWQRFVADFVPPTGVSSWDELLRAEQTDQAASRRPRHPGGAALDRHRRRALLRHDRARAARRRSRGAAVRRPAADLLRPGRGACHGAACRRHRHQLQHRQPGRLGRALFLRRPAPAFRRQAGSHLGMVLRRQREPQRQSQQRSPHDRADPGRTGAWCRRRGPQSCHHPRDRRHSLVPIRRPSEGRPAGRRGLRFRPGRCREPALSASRRGLGPRQSRDAGPPRRGAGRAGGGVA